MKRRTFLKSAALLPMVAYFPHFAMAQSDEQRVLVLVQFGGGNDSLNTFVPFTDEAYYSARGSLAVASSDVLPLSCELGLNPVMSALIDAWQNTDMAVVQGLGYPNPNRSHFRGIDIWHTASDANTVLTNGWLTSVMPDSDSPLQGVIIDGSPGALRGEPNQFGLGGPIDGMSEVYAPDGHAPNSTVEYVMNQRSAYNAAVKELTVAFEQPIETSVEFANDAFSVQCETLAKMLTAGVRPHVVHLSLGSFDTHSNQRIAHDTLLNQLANGLAALRQELLNQGLWQQVTVATYSEFGRRVQVNGSNGTDHGTAASHLVLGGSVNGGLYSQMPSLTDLQDGDLKHTEDFRAYYKTLSDWMSWPASDELNNFDNLGFV